jgi:radical SAM superfamily enzyme YgiQ (UPF0313 family)
MNKKTIYLAGVMPSPSICLALKYLESSILSNPTLRSSYSIHSRSIYLNEWSISNFFLASNPSILNSDVIQDIVSRNPAIIGYSLYPWNIDLFETISRQVKLFLPEAIQVAGGPSVSGFGERLLRQNPAMDFAFEGEAEGSFTEFLVRTLDERGYDDVPGLYMRRDGGVVFTGTNGGCPRLDDIPSPWPEYRREKREYIYYEASRGCQWRCKYCAFPRSRKFQHFSLDRIRHDLGCIMQMNPRSVYFIDSDICGNEEFALELLGYLLEETGETEFGFEFNANTASARVMELLGEMFLRKKLIELEVGVQTTSQKASRLAGRRLDLAAFAKNLDLIRRKAPLLPFKFNLIFGLPGETEEQFYRSVDFLWRFQPCRIVAYPLCVFPGTLLHKQAADLGIRFDDNPPFQVLATGDMPLDSMIRIRKFSALLAVAFYKNPELLDAVSSSVQGSLSEAILSFVDSTAFPTSDYERMIRALIREFTSFLTGKENVP